MTPVVGAGFVLVLLQIALPSVCMATSTPSLGTEEATPGFETVSYDSGGVQVHALLAKPEGTGKHPAVIVIHDSQGLTDEFRDIARQLAAAGFVAMAPDLLSRTGGTQASPQAESAIAALSPKVSVEDLSAGFTFLRGDPNVDPEKISSIGFGWGGWRSFKLAAALPGLRHAVIFYGATPVNGLENVHASVLANYAQYDFFDTGNSIWTEDTLKESGGKFTYYIYPKTFRGFFDPGSPSFDADAARLAWSRTLEFLRS
jgi:carboxymethylenebutenolidase